MPTLFVWIYLPHMLQPKICAEFTHQGSSGLFRYIQSYLESEEAVPIDPIALPLREEEFITTHLNGWFSALLDAGPDAWGRRCIDEALGLQDQRGHLLHGYGHPVGALAFSATPDSPPEAVAPAKIDALSELIAVLARAEVGGQFSKGDARALLPHAGIGGARPKLTIVDDGAMWIAKGPSILDRMDLAPVPIVEAALLSLASELDIQTPKTRMEWVDGRPVLLVRRFDRTTVDGGFLRRRYASVQTILWSKPEVARWSFQGSYNGLALRWKP